MARIRTIKPEFFTSPDTAKVSHAARLLYIAMWCWADDYGRGEMNLLQLRAFAFPEVDPWLEPENNLSKEFQCIVKEVISGFNLRVYTYKGRTFYEIPSWENHQKTQRRANPKIPPSTDPECAPDQRFYNTQGSSETTQGSSETTQGSSSIGTGEREQGKGNILPQNEILGTSVTAVTSPQNDPTPEPEPTKEPEPEPEPEQPPKPAYPAEFKKFWDTYPRKVGKRDALKAWKRATKRATTSAINDGAKRLATDPNRLDRFTPYPATWLNRDGWEDEQTPAYQQQNQTRTFGTRPEDWLAPLATGTDTTPPALYAVPQGDEP